MAGLKEYDVRINGFDTTLRLSEADAKAAGLWREPEPEPVEQKQAPAPKNKARTARKKG